MKNQPFEKEKLNVILLVIDSLKHDHLGCYGYCRDTSPNIDKFARDSLLFKYAFSQGTTTRISVASIFTSLFPGVHRVYKLGAALEDGFITLPEILRNEGYRTAVFAGPQLHGISNLLNRFDTKVVMKHRFSFYRFMTSWLTRKALAWLSRNRSRPFFLYIHYFDVHAPFEAPAPFDKLFWKGDLGRKTRDFIRRLYFIPDREYLKKSEQVDGRVLEYILSQYDGKIRYVDLHLKKILEYLNYLGLAENTMVVLTSDHGEEFREHTGLFHESSLYDELSRVPLIIRMPPQSAPSSGITDSIARHIDIMPSILGALNIHPDSFMQGVSLLNPNSGNPVPKLDAYSETIFFEEHMRSVRTDSHKLIEIRNLMSKSCRYEIYDLKNDAKERRNLIGSGLKAEKELKEKLSGYIISCEEARNSILKKSAASSIILNEETKKQLKSLGYA